MSHAQRVGEYEYWCTSAGPPRYAKSKSIIELTYRYFDTLYRTGAILNDS